MESSPAPFASDKEEDFLEVKTHVEADDLEWVAQQLRTKRLSAQFQLGQFFVSHPANTIPLISFCACSGHDKLAYEIARCSSRAEINLADSQGKTALMHAAYMGKTSLVIVLLSLGADHTLEAHEYKRTALAWAQGTLQQDRWCARLTAFHNLRDYLLCASEETVQLLTDYGLLSTEEERKAFADSRLESAAYNLEVRYRLLRDDAEWMEQELASGRLSPELMLTKDESLLFHAVKLNKTAVVHPLLKHSADPNDTNEYNSSVLVGAAANLNLEVFRLLLLYGAEYRTYEEIGEASPEFNCMENENTELPAYAASWLNMSEAEKAAEFQKYAPELNEEATKERVRLEAMSREELYDTIAGLKTQVQAFENLKRELKRQKRLHHDLTSDC